eukprot:6339496-Amphidinium_carterae.2
MDVACMKVGLLHHVPCVRSLATSCDHAWTAGSKLASATTELRVLTELTSWQAMLESVRIA